MMTKIPKASIIKRGEYRQAFNSYLHLIEACSHLELARDAASNGDRWRWTRKLPYFKNSLIKQLRFERDQMGDKAKFLKEEWLTLVKEDR
jgi:hypothetical protein